MTDAQGYGARIAQALLDYASQMRRRVSMREFGELVAKEEGRPDPYKSSAVGEWIAERSEPRIATFQAMHRVTGKATEWLMALDVRRAAPIAPAVRPPLQKSGGRPLVRAPESGRKKA